MHTGADNGVLTARHYDAFTTCLRNRFAVAPVLVCKSILSMGSLKSTDLAISDLMDSL